ncbi:hypothetical protein HGRIS_012353 [Hohenbuehelia grisea]|uniref:Phospholipase/carboxylesterase/thioesterase domain-containing protein n=1 Tax=Hohenbuehelia grisea TaxID=104357 RepID=A0ABR3IS16_9AGAR
MANSEETIHLTLKDASAGSEDAEQTRVRPAPTTSGVYIPFAYSPSDDGTDENLLILLHGLGDTHVPFTRLARQLKLPQTATLSLRAPDKIPFLYEEAYQWFTSFDGLGELLERADPTPALEILARVINHLIRECGWPPQRIHLFGFAQGGSLALQFAVDRWERGLLDRSVSSASGQGPGAVADSGALASERSSLLTPLGSAVSVCGPLLSCPALSKPCPTPVLLAYRPPPAEPIVSPAALADLKRAFSSPTEAKMNAGGAGMPASRSDWEPIMRFWSERLSRRKISGLYEVMSRGV